MKPAGVQLTVLSERTTSVEEASRRVEERVTAHNDKYTPTVNRLRTSYTPGSGHRFVGRNFRRHVLTAVRAGIAALLVGVWHLESRLGASYLSAAIAVLCSCATIGGTIQRATQAVGGSLATVPLAGACVVAARAAGSDVVGIALLGVWCFLIGATDLPPAMSKTLLALLCGDVTAILHAGASTAILPRLIGPVDACARGAVCALIAAVVVPKPQLASHYVRDAIQQAASGIAVLFAGALAPKGTLAERHQWRLEAERLIGAVEQQLGAELPGLLAEAAWEPWVRRRAAAAWDARQLHTLHDLLKLACAADQARRALCERASDGRGDAALSHKMLALLHDDLEDMCDLLKEYALRVAGAPHDAAAETAQALASKCSVALDGFETAFGKARLELIYHIDGGPTTSNISTLTACYACLFASTHVVMKLEALLTPATAQQHEPPPRASCCARFAAALKKFGPRLHSPAARLAGVRAAIALGGASSLGLLSQEPQGFWAAVTAAFVLGGASSLRVAAMRLQGTVVGAAVSYAALVGTKAIWPDATRGGNESLHRDATLLVGLGLWVAVCTFVREASAINGYAGFVAAFSASILLFGPECGGIGAHGACADARDEGEGGGEMLRWAMARIEFTLLGITVVLVVATCTSNPAKAASSALVDIVWETRELYRHVHAAWVDGMAGLAVGASPRIPASKSAPAIARAAASAERVDDGPVSELAAAEEEGAQQQQEGDASAEQEGPRPAALTRANSAVGGTRKLSVEAPNASLISPVWSDDGREGDRATRFARATAALQGRARVRDGVRSSSSDGGAGREARAEAEAEVAALRARLHGKQRGLRELAREAAEAPQCWRHPYPEHGVGAVREALGAVVDMLGVLHMTCVALRPGGAVLLLQPLMKPLNRVELDIAACLEGLVQDLRGGVAASRFLSAATARRPALLQSLQLLEESFAEVVVAIIECDRLSLHDNLARGQPAVPRILHRDILTLNTLIYSARTLGVQVQQLDRQVNELRSMQEPVDLRAISFEYRLV